MRHTYLTRLAAATVAVLSAIGLAVLLPGTASAQDGRAASPRDEIQAQFVHSLDRLPDPAAFDTYMQFVDENCQWGIIDATYRIANSPEAANRWQNDPQHLAGMLYASLLNRTPDPDGLTTYTNSIRDRGLSWSTAQMLGSTEYRGRLADICNTTDGLNASMFDWQSGLDFANEVLIPNAKSLAATCVGLEGIKNLTGIEKNAKSVKLFIGVVGEVTNAIHDRIDGTCEAAVSQALAAKRIAEVIDAGEGDNPVLIQLDSHRSWWTLKGVQYFTIRIGPNPTEWEKFDGKVAGF